MAAAAIAPTACTLWLPRERCSELLRENSLAKTEVRREARQRLASLAEPVRREAARLISERVWTVPEIAAASALMIYASLPSEVDTDLIAAEAVRRGVNLVYPRCLTEGGRMTLHRVQAHAELLADGRYGIREPDSSCPIVDPAEVDAALIPGLAWDRNGARLGRGAGYYDRLLQDPRWRGFKCGLFFSVQEFERLPTDPHDSPLDAVVTEAGILNF